LALIRARSVRWRSYVGHRTDFCAAWAHPPQEPGQAEKGKEMIAETTETGWKRFLDRIRKLWEAPPQHYPVPARVAEHEVSASAHTDDTPPMSQR
jgi:hypothetical protein